MGITKKQHKAALDGIIYLMKLDSRNAARKAVWAHRESLGSTMTMREASVSLFDELISKELSL